MIFEHKICICIMTFMSMITFDNYYELDADCVLARGILRTKATGWSTWSAFMRVSLHQWTTLTVLHSHRGIAPETGK